MPISGPPKAVNIDTQPRPVDFPPPPAADPYPWNDDNKRQLRAALVAAAKRLPHNPEVHFHLGLMHMRRADGEEALRAFQQAKMIYEERQRPYIEAGAALPPRLAGSVAKLRSHTAQAAHLAASTRLSREERAPLLDRLQKDLVSSTQLDCSQPDVWNALALLHLTEGGYTGARDVLQSIHESFPEYLDAINNLGLTELALGNEEAAASCFQQVILGDRNHAAALSNYGLILLRRGMFDSAASTFERAVQDSKGTGRGLASAWAGLAVARVAMGQFGDAEDAAVEAQRLGDVNSHDRFSQILFSIRARQMVAELRRGTSMEAGNSKLDAERSGGLSDASPSGPAKRRRQSRGSGLGGEAVSSADYERYTGVDHEQFHEEEPMTDLLESAPQEPRPGMDAIVTRMRSLARELCSSSSSTSLGAALRLRHTHFSEETGGRNSGAEAAERLVEALEYDETDSSAWVQLALLQMGIGEFDSARDFSVQAVSRSRCLEAGWNSLGVAYQLANDLEDSDRAYERALLAIVSNYSRKRNELPVLIEDTGFLGVEQHHGKFSWECVSDGGDDIAPNVPMAEREFNRLLKRKERHQHASDVAPDTESSVSGDDFGMRNPLGSFSINQLSDYREDNLSKAGLLAMAAVYNNIGNLRRQQATSFEEAQTAY
jgi:tetratricopeptide (TPR) repeat protein